MINEDFCFEVAKLLKDKGFNEYCLKNYWSSDKELHDWKWELSYNRNSDENRNTKDCAAPTQQMAMKWLREEHQLHISVDVSPIYGKVKDEKGRNTCGLLYWHYMASGEWVNEKYNPNQKAFIVSAKSYEDAVEEALKYSLENLI